MRLWWPLQHLMLHCSSSLAGDGLSTRRTPALPSSSAPRRLRCLLRVGLFEERRAELCDDVWAAFDDGFLVDVLAITFQNVVGCLRFSVRAGLHAGVCVCVVNLRSIVPLLTLGFAACGSMSFTISRKKVGGF